VSRGVLVGTAKRRASRGRCRAGHHAWVRSSVLDGLRGTWRVAVVENSMAPAIEPGDWLLIDPTARRWPRVGSVVVFRAPESELFAIKRIAARGGQHVSIEQGLLHLEPDEAWLLGDAAGASVDSRRYGPVAFDRYVGRAWFRYAPLRRIGPLRQS
jgi:signal peptidase I